jgi:cytochrome P450
MAITSAAGASEIDLTRPGHYRSGFPHELFADLRGAGSVHRHPVVDVPGAIDFSFWSVVRHQEVQEANRDWETFSVVDGPNLAPTDLLRDLGMMVALDPPRHSRLRRLISAGFTPRMIAGLEKNIEWRSERILDDVIARGDDIVDFVEEIAHLLPMHVIADIVGIPEEDRPRVFKRVDYVLRSFDPAVGISETEQLTAQMELFEYAQGLAERKRAQPADDVWTTLTMAAVADDDGEPTALSDAELDSFFMILAVGGSETTRNVLAQGLMALVEQPEEVAALRADRSLLPSAADEMIRWASPVLMFGRTATRDVELGDQLIAAGDRIVLWYPSANRDELVFTDPFRFDVHRRPNPHVSFGGGGPHYCLGANLAKKEVQVMLGALLRRFTTIELAGPPQWMGAGPVHSVGVSVDHLPVRLRAH